jgi:hypothetical protein
VQVSIQPKQDRILLDRRGVIGDGGNSGFQALNLAAQFGARCILLVGYDMRLDRGVHWFGKHGRGLNNPGEQHLPRWRAAIDGAADTLKTLGIRVFNCSPVSTLKAYPMMTFDEAMACCD